MNDHSPHSPPLYSIGYATKPLEQFLQQLQEWHITAVADVRSVPYSAVFHDYHREALAASLRAAGIHYVYLGEELGPRSRDPAHYDGEGQVQFDRLQRAPLFERGIRRLHRGLDRGERIAMLCAEKDPAVCHRSLLIAHHLLVQDGIDTAHVHHDGGIELETDLRRRLMELNAIVPDMVTPLCECLDIAWRAQSRRCAYRKPK